MLLALDDTDSPTGGCTTYTALELVARAGLTLRGMPRLVRLNPNCPHKTRGNGAVVLPLAAPTGPRVQIGSWKGEPVYAFPDGEPPVIDAAALWTHVQDLAQPDAAPGLALVDDALPEGAYWQAVRGQVDEREARQLLEASSAITFGGRGLIGCMGALAWPGPASSHELLAYREARRWGTPRLVAPAPLERLDENGHFHTADGGLACVPSTPCPVLAGLRAIEPEPLRDVGLPALHAAAGEAIAGWALWATNQASGNHITAIERLEQAPTWSTVRLAATVEGAPTSRAGGHVHVPCTDAAGAPLTLIAFEPTGTFRHAVLALARGDAVVATGALHDGAIHLESLRLKRAVPVQTPPPCCGVSMKSRGVGAGYKCAKCGGAGEAVSSARPTGAWEVPVKARRHLHRPLAW